MKSVKEEGNREEQTRKGKVRRAGSLNKNMQSLHTILTEIYSPDTSSQFDWNFLNKGVGIVFN